jgi:hypothetical protein
MTAPVLSSPSQLIHLDPQGASTHDGRDHRWQTAKEMGRAGDLARLSVRFGDLVHELQIERGMSAVFLGTGGQQLAAELPTERSRTDARRAALS